MSSISLRLSSTWVHEVLGLRIITFKAEENLLEKIDLTAKELGMTRSELIRLAIETFIKLRASLEQGEYTKLLEEK